MLEKLQKIKILICDVDGVMTDGGLYYTEDGKVLKRFCVQDGLGIKLAQKAGLEIAVVTGLRSASVRKRIEGLGITRFYEGFLKKERVIKEIVKEMDISLEEVAYIGDDWVDAIPMQMVGFPMAVNNAQPEIKRLALWISCRRGGDGAVREAISFILNAQGKLKGVWREWER